MADDYTAPAQRNVNDVVTAAQWNEQVPDNITALFNAIVGDGQATEEVIHRHLSDTLANRPAAGEAGRIYYASDVGDDGIWFRDNGSNWKPLGVQVIEHNLDRVDIENINAEQEVYAFTIPAGLLGTTSGVRLTMYGDMLVNTAGNLTLRTRLPSGIILESQTIDPADSGARRNWCWIVEMINSAADAQKWGTKFDLTNASAEEWPVPTGGNIYTSIGLDSSSDDTSGAKLFRVTAHWSATSASLSFRKEQAVLELL